LRLMQELALETVDQVLPKSYAAEDARRTRLAASRFFDGLTEFVSAPTSYIRNEEVFGEGEPAEYIYKIETGCIQTYNTLANGRRKIRAFYLPGDCVGLEAQNDYDCCAQAVTVSSALAINRKTLILHAERDISLLQQLLKLTSMDLRQARNHNKIMHKGAQERVIEFFLEMKHRNQNRDEFDLPMSRLDIADYLGLSIETVSRVFTRLKAACAISMPKSRRVILRNISLD